MQNDSKMVIKGENKSSVFVIRPIIIRLWRTGIKYEKKAMAAVTKFTDKSGWVWRRRGEGEDVNSIGCLLLRIICLMFYFFYYILESMWVWFKLSIITILIYF